MNILTFDIEDWWVYDYYSLGVKKDYLPRINNCLDKILSLLAESNLQATFFCLGEVALKHPEVIKKIADKNHHIGCHSFSHKFLGNLNYREVEVDTKNAIDSIENIIGEKVTAYRAPAFSITENNKWVLEVLARNGITHDCSIFPANRSFGGFPSFKSNKPAIINYEGIQIKEFPMSTSKFLGKEIVFSGGGYFRLFPYWKIKSLMKKSNYVMTYFHIKDFDYKQQRKYSSLNRESAIFRYFKDYYGLKGNFNKFLNLISDFDFISLKQADSIIDWDKAPIVNI
tara:strand:- start:283 stop:1134 length:852 start_codon:yes stop_codon:yes gene_type:complete